MELEVLKVEVAKLSLGPNDTLVLRCNRALSEHERCDMARAVKGVLGDRLALILDDSCRLSILTDVD